jgi:type IV pilus assembly protein PilY1
MDAVYAGDLLGNVWRLDVTAATGAYPAPVKIATLTDSSGVAQPVTSRPIIEIQPRSNKRFVFVGTGRLLDSSDIASTQMQTFYAIADGTNVRFNRTTDLPSGITFPISRSNLAQLTDPTVGVTINPSTQIGWYLEFGTQTSGIAWRNISEPTSFFGRVAFSSILPTNEDVCSPSGESRIYVLEFDTGKSVQLDRSATRSDGSVDTSAVVISYSRVGSIVTDLKFLSRSGTLTGMYGTNSGATGSLNLQPLTATGLQRVNWREIPSVD